MSNGIIPLFAVVIVTGAVAVIDPAWPAIIGTVVGAVIIITPMWFKYKQDMLTKKLEAALKELADTQEKIKTQGLKIDEVEKATNGVTAALVKASKEASHAEGVIAGVAQAETKAAVVTAALADGKAAGILQEQEAEINRLTTPPP